MARRTLTVVAGVLLSGGLVVGAGAGVASAAGDVPGHAGLWGRPSLAGPPVATPPASTATATVIGTPVNGVQLSMVAPKQLPMDLSDSVSPAAPREFDVTVKDVGGAGYSGTVSTVFTEESAASAGGFLVRGLQRFDPVSNTWQTLTTPTGTQTKFQDDAPVTVPAGGQVIEKYRCSAGINVFDDLKVVTSANGASVTAVAPVTQPKLDVAGLPGSIRAGVPYPVTGSLVNPTDVDYSGVDVEFFVQACDKTAQKCFQAKDTKLEVQSGGVWKAVALQDTQQVPGLSGFALKNVTLAHGATLSIPLRLTLPVNNLQVNPMHFAMSPNVAPEVTSQGTLIAAPVPSAATRSSQPSAPSASQASTSASSTPTDSPSASPSDSGSPTATPSSGPLNEAPVASSTSSSNATVLLAVGLLVLCGGLVGGYFYLKRREQV